LNFFVYVSGFFVLPYLLVSKDNERSSTSATHFWRKTCNLAYYIGSLDDSQKLEVIIYGLAQW